ncbi:MAG: hypothetical protein V2B14_04210 [bacterium]
MAKAINWAEEFYDEIMKDDFDNAKTAIRLGSLYFDNAYYTDNEIIDIRVNHKIVRKAQIIGEMKLAKIKELLEDTLSIYKNILGEKCNIVNFLAKYYNEPVDDETLVTIINYKNLSKELGEIADDPHN